MAVNGRIQKDGQAVTSNCGCDGALAGVNAGGRVGKPTPFR